GLNSPFEDKEEEIEKTLDIAIDQLVLNWKYKEITAK
ncbi:unnamed protein product, partial [marine sediment metagenome]